MPRVQCSPKKTHTHTHTQKEPVPFAATWMDPQVIILSKSDKEKQISYDITRIWNLKKKKKGNTNEFIYKTETGSQILKTNLWLSKGRHGGEIN